MEQKDSALDAILAAAKQRTRGGHSPLYEWFWRHYDRLVVEFGPPITPNWAAMAEQFGKDGIMDGTGKPPTATTVRQTFWRVGRDRDAIAAGTYKRGKRGRKPAPKAPPLAHAAAPSRAAPADPVADQQPQGDRPRRQFKTLNPKRDP